MIRAVTTRISFLHFAAMASALIAGIGGNYLIGETTFPNAICGPAAMPVTSCECPLGAGHADRCEGTLPKNGGNMYGNVMCSAQPGSSCLSGATGMNSCGRIAMCPCITCGTPIYILGCGCTIFNNKPPCSNTWGNCAYSYPP